MALPKSRLIDIAKSVYGRMKEHDVSGTAAELSYRFFLALFPFMIFLAALGGFVAKATGVADPTQEIMDELGKSLPADAASLLRDQIDAAINSRSIGLVSIGVVGALLAASSGVGTMMKAMNRAYEVRETRPSWKRYLLAISLTALGGTLLIVSFTVFVVGQVYGQELADRLNVGGAAATLFKFSRWPLVVVLSLLATSVLYWASPNIKLRFRIITSGAVLFTVGWLLASYVFSVYVSHLGSYNTTYGTLGGVVVTLIWFYIISLILLVGAELNSALAAESQLPEVMNPTSKEDEPASTVSTATQPVGTGQSYSKAIRRERRRDVVVEAEASTPARRVGAVSLALGALFGLLTLRRALHAGQSAAARRNVVQATPRPRR